jgi:hypothetical protein
MEYHIGMKFITLEPERIFSALTIPAGTVVTLVGDLSWARDLGMFETGMAAPGSTTTVWCLRTDLLRPVRNEER